MAVRESPQPFPIADFTEGLMVAREPWISPKNAFRTMTNARVFRGRLEKRTGVSRFAETTGDSSDRTFTTVSPGNNASTHIFNNLIEGTFPDFGERIIPESITLSAPLGAAAALIYAEMDMNTLEWRESTSQWTYSIVDQGGSTVLGTVLFDPTGGAPYNFAMDWSVHPSYDSPRVGQLTIDYRVAANDPVMGLHRFTDTSGDFSIALDTNRVYSYNAGNGYYAPQGKSTSYAAYFTGDNEDYWWVWDFDDWPVFTNGVDAPVRWDPTAATNSSVIEMETDWNGAGQELDTCKFLVRFGGRCIYFNTTESGTRYPTRARWTAAGSFTTWNSPNDWADAPVELGEAVSCEFIGDRLFVAFENGWFELRLTGDVNAPFEWVPAISRFGAVSVNSLIKDNERLLHRSETSMQAIDPNGQYYMDVEIPDLVLGYNPGETQQCVAIRNEAQRAFWWTAAKELDERPGHILVATYTEDTEVSWSEYTRAYNAFADFESNQTPTWNSLGPLTWNQLSGFTWNNAQVGRPGFVQTLAGGDDGVVYIFNANSIDNMYIEGPQNIPMEVVSQELAPFPGQRAVMTWIDVYAEAGSGAELSLSFFADHQPAAYKSITIDLTPTLSSTKVYRRVPIGRSAQYHRIKITNNDNVTVKIDALVPFFRPAGRVVEFS